jgi:putative DNA primase/helicase
VTFIQFAESHGLIVDRLIEGRWVRVKTTDKQRKRNGAYKYLGDIGFVQNHATMEEVAVWRNGSNAGHMDKSALRAHRVISDAQTAAKQAEARIKALDMIQRASIDKHPYLAAKGFPDEQGFILDGEFLIPMREFRRYRQLNSLQRISSTGSKLFLPGGKAKGSVFLIGPSSTSERWLVEGYATGLSVRSALRELRRDAQVVVCFSASNLAHIGRLVSGMSGKAFVMADNDKSEAGTRAALESGLPWVIPPKQGMDANDFHRCEGLRALVSLIRNERAPTIAREMIQ